MKPSIDNVRALAGQNAALIAQARQTHDKIIDAAQAECDRLSKLIAGTNRADVLADPAKAEVYLQQVQQRASLMRLLAERHE